MTNGSEGTAPAEGLVLQRLREKFGDALGEVTVWRHETTVLLRPQDLVRVCRFLKDDPDLAFDFLSDVTGVDAWSSLSPRPASRSSITSTRSSSSAGCASRCVSPRGRRFPR